MIKYVALLRGINVGGNSIIKMAALKICFEKCGYKNVKTFIQSGNVIFESDEKSAEKIVQKLESNIVKTFNVQSRVVLRTIRQIKKVVGEIPAEWKKQKNLRCYVAFIKEPMTAAEASKEVELKKGVDFMKVGDGVLYLTSIFSQRTKSSFTKLASKKIYKEMTIRNYNTTQKLLKLMEE